MSSAREFNVKESKNSDPLKTSRINLYDLIRKNSKKFHIILPDEFKHFRDPISLHFYKDPQITSCNHVIENEVLKQWRQKQEKEDCDKCPLCKKLTNAGWFTEYPKPLPKLKDHIMQFVEKTSSFLKTLKPRKFEIALYTNEVKKMEPNKIYITKRDRYNITYKILDPLDNNEDPTHKPAILTRLIHQNELTHLFNENKLSQVNFYDAFLTQNTDLLNEIYLLPLLSILHARGDAFPIEFDAERTEFISHLDDFYTYGYDFNYLSEKISEHLSNGSYLQASQECSTYSSGMCAIL